MNLIKTKGIIIKEIPFKENDKIVTILTDKLGKISCIAKGAKKTNSRILANAQYLVYSDFVLYHSKNFYYINSAEVVNTFYNLRVDFDKLQSVFELTKILHHVTDENQDTSEILKLFLNTIYVIDNMQKKPKFVMSVFQIKLFQLLGFSPRVDMCTSCYKKNENNDMHYDYVNNSFVCDNCLGQDKRRYIKVSASTLIAIRYVIISDIKKIFSFELKDSKDLELFGQVYTDAMTNSI